MSVKYHLSLTGLKPCEATIRACTYSHVNNDGSFEPGTSVTEMYEVVTALEKSIASSPISSQATVNIYFNARKNYEASLAEGNSVPIQVMLNSQYVNAASGLLLQEENFDETKQYLLGLANSANSQHEIETVGNHISILIDKGHTETESRREEDDNIYNRLIIEVIGDINNPKVLEDLSIKCRNGTFVTADLLAEPLITNPNSSETVKTQILRNSKLPVSFKEKYADSTPSGWINITISTTSWDWDTNGEKQAEIFVKAYNQVTNARKGTLSPYDVNYLLANSYRAKITPEIPVNALFNSLGKREKSLYPGKEYEALEHFASTHAEKLNKASLLKITSLISENDLNVRYSSLEEQTANFNTFRNKIVNRTLVSAGGRLRTSGEFQTKEYSAQEKRQAKINLTKAIQNRAGDKIIQLQTEYDKAHLESLIKEYRRAENKMGKIQADKSPYHYSLHPFVTDFRLKRDRVVRAKNQLDWEALNRYIETIHD